MSTIHVNFLIIASMHVNLLIIASKKTDEDHLQMYKYKTLLLDKLNVIHQQIVQSSYIFYLKNQIPLSYFSIDNSDKPKISPKNQFSRTKCLASVSVWIGEEFVDGWHDLGGLVADELPHTML